MLYNIYKNIGKPGFAKQVYVASTKFFRLCDWKFRNDSFTRFTILEMSGFFLN